MSLSGCSEGLQLVAIVAHPHDITHMAGTCAHHVERGDTVTAVAVTGGESTHNERLYDELRKPPEERNMEIVLQSSDAYASQKAAEMREVCGLFGITDVRVLPFSDKPFRVTDDLVQVLAEILYEVRPHIILTHAPYAPATQGRMSITPDDHSSTGVAVHQALATVGTPDREGQRIPHRVAAVYYTGVDVPRRDIELFVDITDQAANRLAAEKLFTTQGHTAEFAHKRIEIGAGGWGWSAHVAYAEPFIRAHAEVSRYLTVTDEALSAPEMSQEDMMARMSKQITATQSE
ncbi:MAG: PIG-L family deacetylase [Armatimonadetes bacterium]|nr:PIG-L family deacetylase [Armatimonadota bacterium]